MGNSNTSAPEEDFSYKAKKQLRRRSDKYMKEINTERKRSIKRVPSVERNSLYTQPSTCCCSGRASSFDRQCNSKKKNEWVDFCRFNLKNLARSDDWVSDIVRFVKRYRKDFNPRPYLAAIYTKNRHLISKESQADRERFLSSGDIMKMPEARSVSQGVLTSIAKQKKKKRSLGNTSILMEDELETLNPMKPRIEKLFLTIKAQLLERSHPVNIIIHQYKELFVATYKRFVDKTT